MAKNSIIAQGTTYRIFDSSIETYDELPVGTYKVQFNPFQGFSLLRIDDLTAGTEKVYGNHDARVSRMSQAYGTLDRSLGILMSGDKGMGKSMSTRLIADKFRNDHNLPTVIVDESNDGLADFIDSLGECAVIFDEFEKKFGKGEQNAFLSLFDGLSTKKRVYVVTVNDMFALSDFIINRPGRFHYHIRFDYPTVAQTREYLRDQTINVTDEQIEQAVTFSQKVKLNYDHLRALAFELSLGGTFGEVINDLNIKNLGNSEYVATVTLSDGTILTETDCYDLFSSERQLVSARTTIRGMSAEAIEELGFENHFARRISDHGLDVNLNFWFKPSSIRTRDDGVLEVPIEAIDSVERSKFVEHKGLTIESITLALRGQNTYSYGGYNHV